MAKGPRQRRFSSHTVLGRGESNRKRETDRERAVSCEQRNDSDCRKEASLCVVSIKRENAFLRKLLHHNRKNHNNDDNNPFEKPKRHTIFSFFYHFFSFWCVIINFCF
ncbi:hypothetical protein RJT34_33092 [Clitoria ternatea]|uniref:Transmembrane protein n=1 Tax=Clitoria ternatea TaxID=43366 RepID=A0AAN9EX70_CLITE